MRFIWFIVLKNAFDAFDQEKNGFISVTMVGTILAMLGHQLDEKMLNEIVAEVDEDGSGQIEFEEFCTLAARFLVEEDAEAMQQELKEAFRLYDKEGKLKSGEQKTHRIQFNSIQLTELALNFSKIQIHRLNYLGAIKYLNVFCSPNWFNWMKFVDLFEQAMVTSQQPFCVKS